MITKISPHPSLSEVVNYYWINDQENGKIKIFPDGSVNILFNLINPYILNNSNESYNIDKGAWVIGPHKRFYFVEKEKNTREIGIKFKQGGAHSFFKFPINQIANKVMKINSSVFNEHLNILNKMEKTNDQYDIKIIIDRFLLENMNDNNNGLEVIDYIIKKVQLNGSPELIKNLSIAASMTHKHLITLFKDKVGMSPKMFYRINKFNMVLEIISKSDSVNWTEIAYQCHYYDQSHMINDFRYFTGITPKVYYEKKYTRSENIVFN